MYLKGEGVPVNMTTSLDWLRKAADQGDPTAQFNLGVMYSSGKGVPKDPVQAYMWADIAASRGDTNSAQLLATLQKTTSPDQIAEAERKKREWKPNLQYFSNIE